MTHKEFVLGVQKACHIDHQQCTMLLNALCKLMAQAGVEQVPITIQGLGTFTSHKHPEYLQEDPQTGRMTLYPPRITYRMHAEDIDAPSDALARQLSEKTRTELDQVSSFLTNLTSVVFEGLDHGEEVEVKGLGTFRNIVTHQGELKRVAYTPDQQMRSLVNAPFNCFEPVPADGMEPVETILPEASTADEQEGIVEPAIVEPSVLDTADETAAVNEEIEHEPAEPEPIETSVMEPEPPAVTETNEPEVVNPAPIVINLENNNDMNKDIEEQEPIDSHDETVSAAHDDDDDFPYSENNLNRNSSKLLYSMIALIVLACIGLAWFIYTIDNRDYNQTNYAARNTEIADEESPVLADTMPKDAIGPSAEVVPVVEEPVAPVVESTVPVEEKTTSVDEKKETKPVETKPVTPVAEGPKAEKPSQQSTEKPATATNDAKTTVDPKSRMKNPDGTFATYKLKQGDRLTLVALEHYGNKAFWPYIFEVNRDKLKSPSLVQTGMQLYLPDPAYFGIDANDPESVRKAKLAAVPLMK